MKKLVLTCLSLAAALACQPRTARADTVAFSTTNVGSTLYSQSNTFGYTFTVSSAVSVTQLGFYDYLADGLTNAVPVSIWNSGGTMLTRATVPAGTSTGEVSGFLYVNLATPVILPAGTYTIGGYVTSSSDMALYGGTITAASGLTYGGSRLGNNDDSDPTRDLSTSLPHGFFGPNFEFNTPSVPEPGTWAGGALLVGAAGLTLRRPSRRGPLPHCQPKM